MADDAEPKATDRFVALRQNPEPIGDRSREAARGAWRVFRAEGGFEAALHEHVLERAILVGRRAAPLEWLGLVVGRVHEHAGGRHVTVEGFVEDVGAVATAHTVRSTPESELETRVFARVLYPDAVVIGWIHGHLRHGARFSSVDVRNQATWTQPHALGIVVDPWDEAGTVAVYRGPRSERLMEVTEERPPPVPADASAPAPAVAETETVPG